MPVKAEREKKKTSRIAAGDQQRATPLGAHRGSRPLPPAVASLVLGEESAHRCLTVLLESARAVPESRPMSGAQRLLQQL